MSSASSKSVSLEDRVCKVCAVLYKVLVDRGAVDAEALTGCPTCLLKRKYQRRLMEVAHEEAAKRIADEEASPANEVTIKSCLKAIEKHNGDPYKALFLAISPVTLQSTISAIRISKAMPEAVARYQASLAAQPSQNVPPSMIPETKSILRQKRVIKKAPLVIPKAIDPSMKDANHDACDSNKKRKCLDDESVATGDKGEPTAKKTKA